MATNRSRRAALHSSCPEVSTVTRETPGNADGDVFPGLELRFQRHFPDLSVTARARSFHATLTGLSVCRAGACRDARQSRIQQDPLGLLGRRLRPGCGDADRLRAGGVRTGRHLPARRAMCG